MSINQIQESTTYPLWRDWLLSRINNAEIYSQLNLNIDEAVPGDIMVLDSFLDVSWQPSSVVASLTLDNMMTVPLAYNFIPGAFTPMPLNQSPVIISPHITINAQSQIIIDTPGIYMIFLNFLVNTVQTTMNPGVNLQRYSETVGGFVNDFAGLSATPVLATLGSTVPFNQTLSSCWPVIIATTGSPRNQFRIMGSNFGTTSCSLVPTASSLTIVRLS